MDTLDAEKSLQLLAEAPVAHLGTVADGLPYVTPMSFVVHESRILFRTMGGKKLEALRSQPKVCVEVSKFDPQSGNWASVIVRGTAREVEEGSLKALVVERLFEKYADAIGDPMRRGGLQPLMGLPHVVEVEIEEMTGMTSGRALGPRTRPGRL